MVTGINIFRDHFSGYTDQYVLIGGSACDLLMEEEGLEFRPTKDVDMVLIVEALTAEFANAFWEFIETGKYSARQRGNGKPEFYRFVDPQEPGYPSMIELFARPGSNISIAYTGHLVPLHISDDISSLSAILLNEAYYSFLLEGRTKAEMVSVLDGVHLIPMKMKAWLDLNRQKAEGIHINSRDLRKHRQDVFRLFPLISPDVRVAAPKEVYQDIMTFIDAVAGLPFEPKNIGISIGKEHILESYRNLYYVNDADSSL